VSNITLPTSEKIIQPAAVGRFVQRDFATITPGDLRAIFTQTDRVTKIETYADLGEWIAEDDRISAVLDTRIDFVASLPFDLKPGRALPGQEAIAQKAADDCRAMLESTDRLVQVFDDLLNAYWLGYSAGEHLWERDGGWWVSRPTPVRPRDISFSNDWDLLFRSYAGGNTEQWINPAKFPGKFISFLYRKRGSTPLRSGLLRSLGFLWLGKRWAYKFWLAGAERLGTPPMIGRVGRTTNATARDTLREGLINLTEGQAAILEEETNIEFPDTKFSTSADVWEKLIARFDAAITIAALGSLDNTDAGAGSYARAQSQGERNLDPRNSKLAYLLYEVIERDWLAPYLELNSDKYGGVVPPTPRMCPAEGEISEIKPIEQFHIDLGVVTKNEVRAQLGLEPVDGGDVYLEPASGGDAADIPLARKLSAKSNCPDIPEGSTRPRTSVTFFDAAMFSDQELAATSADRAASSLKPLSTELPSSTISPKKPRRASARRKVDQTPNS
jgi:phage gp29-like protein